MGAEARKAQSGRMAWTGFARGFCLTVLVVAVTVLAIGMAAPPPAGAAAPSLLFQAPEDGATGAGAGQLRLPLGVGADPSAPGHVYVADRNNNRISEFTAWGEFVKAWGWEVDAADPQPELQSCTAESGCQAGSAGSGAGQFDTAEAVAVDGSGMVYVIESKNSRVQKFDPEGGPGESAALVGSFGEAGPGPGQLDGGTNAYLKRLAACQADDDVFVGEAERIQRFDSEGNFEEAIATPAGKAVRAIATDAACDLYVDYVDAETRRGEPGVWKIAPEAPYQVLAEFAPESANDRPRALALDGAGNLYVMLPNAGFSDPEPDRVRKYDAEGNCLTCGEEGEGGKPGFDRVADKSQIKGVAASGACDPGGEGEVAYPIHFAGTVPNRSYLRGYGVPDGSVCPPPLRPPAVVAEYATAVGVSSATIRAEINPRFWSGTTGTTSYHAQWATSACVEAGGWEAACVKRTADPPGVALGGAATNSPVPTAALGLEGLEPATSYSYRFVAVSEGGGPTHGEEARFTTFGAAPAPPCPNDGYRTGASAALPDCRAYELVSPLDKEGGGTTVLAEFTSGLPATLSQSAAGGERMAYGSNRAFGGPPSAPYTSQYLAARHAGSGWSSHGISPPARSTFYSVTKHFDNQFRAFSADLCTGWVQTFADPQPAAAAPEGFSDIYRRTDSECGGPAYAPLNTTEPPALAAALFDISLQGFSADERSAIFLADDALAAGASAETPQLYGRRGGVERMLCVLPVGAPVTGPCTAGGRSSGFVNAAQSRYSRLQGAISADGERVFWTQTKGGPGPLYVREHPFEPESAHRHGTASGAGDLAGPVTATGNLASFRFTVTHVHHVGDGRFVVGQEIASPEGSIPPGTRIEAIEEVEEDDFTLTLTAKPTAIKSGAVLEGVPSDVIGGAEADSGAFAAGQEIVAANGGLPAGTRIEAVSETAPGVFELTLSDEASVGGPAVGLRAAGPCAEPAKACTLAVSGEAEKIEGAEGSRFQAAAADGSRALFVTNGTLYEHDLEAEATTEIAGEVVGSLLGASEDAKRAYFVSREARAPGAEAGEANIYFHEAGGGFQLIGALEGEDLSSGASPVASSPAAHTARVNASGLQAAFTAITPLTGYDNTDLRSGEADAEVYLYDAGAEELLCASCNPGGGRPLGRELREGAEIRAAARIPVFQNELYGSRLLSPDGKRLFFLAQDALTPADTNGREDVYQWEAAGKGGCTASSASYSPQNRGCVDLISSGKGGLDARFLDADASGDNVFFATISSLVSQDYGLVDVYDARVEGGLPSPEGPAPECEGEACQSPPPPPQANTPASATYSGPGNLTEAASPFARCNRAGRRARGLSAQAKKLRRKAARLARHRRNRKATRRAGALRRKAARHAKRARRQAGHAKRCRARVRKQRRASSR